MTIEPYANILDPDETPSNSGHIFTNFEQYLSTLKIEEDDNLFGGLRVNQDIKHAETNLLSKDRISLPN